MGAEALGDRMSAQTYRREAAEVRKIIAQVRKSLRLAKSGAMRALVKEQNKLRKRQATLAARARRIAEEYGRNRDRIKKLSVQLAPLLEEARKLEAETERLKARRDQAIQLYFENLNPKRQAAARKGGRKSAELRGEWLDSYLRTVPDDSPQALAVAVARRSGWLHLHPERAAERFREWLQADGEQEQLAHQIAAAERKVRAEMKDAYRAELERSLADVPF